MKRRRRQQWAKRASAILRLAFFGSALFILAPPAARAQDSIRITHNFKVPDTSGRVSPMLPLVSEYLPNWDYERWWQEIADCEGLWLPPAHARIRFFQINAVHFYDRDH